MITSYIKMQHKLHNLVVRKAKNRGMKFSCRVQNWTTESSCLIKEVREAIQDSTKRGLRT